MGGVLLNLALIACMLYLFLHVVLGPRGTAPGVDYRWTMLLMKEKNKYESC